MCSNGQAAWDGEEGTKNVPLCHTYDSAKDKRTKALQNKNDFCSSTIQQFLNAPITNAVFLSLPLICLCLSPVIKNWLLICMEKLRTYCAAHNAPFIAPGRFTDATAAVAQIKVIYENSLVHLRKCLDAFVAGAIHNPLAVSAAPRPSGQRRPGEWVARYAQRHLKPTARAGLDYALLTHLHPDHLGDLHITTPLSASGGYRLTGISDVEHALPHAALRFRRQCFAQPNMSSPS